VSGRYLAVLAGITAVAGAVLYFYSGESARPELRIDARDPAQVARGRAVYEQRCAVCHGQQLEGQENWRIRLANGRMPAPPHDHTGHTWHHPEEVLLAIVRNGLVPPHAPAGYPSDMPAFRKVLSEEDIRAVLAYIESRWSGEVMKIREEMLAQSRGARR
jgi:mono/diheme cytochrome c family protein